MVRCRGSRALSIGIVAVRERFELTVRLPPAPGTPAARELLACPRRFERPTFATGAFTHILSEQNQARCRWRAFRLLRPSGARSSAG
jgi:hypothetical protein